MISDWSNQGACPSSYIKKANGCICIPRASHLVSNGLSLHAPRQRCRVTNRGKCRAFLSSGWGTSTASGRGLQGALSRYTGSGEGSVEFDLRATFPNLGSPEKRGISSTLKSVIHDAIFIGKSMINGHLEVTAKVSQNCWCLRCLNVIYPDSSSVSKWFITVYNWEYAEYAIYN